MVNLCYTVRMNVVVFTSKWTALFESNFKEYQIAG